MNKLVTFFRETSMGRFLIGAGIILIIFGCIVRSFAKDNANYIKTDAVVTKTELFEESDEKNNTEALYTVDVKYIVEKSMVSSLAIKWETRSRSPMIRKTPLRSPSPPGPAAINLRDICLSWPGSPRSLPGSSAWPEPRRNTKH